MDSCAHGIVVHVLHAIAMAIIIVIVIMRVVAKWARVLHGQLDGLDLKHTTTDDAHLLAECCCSND